MTGKISRALLDSESPVDSYVFIDPCYEPSLKVFVVVDLMLEITTFRYLDVMGHIRGDMSQD